MLFDSHAHLNFGDFEDDWQQVIADCQKNNIWLVNVGSQLETSKKTIEIADQYDQGVYAAVGLHPIHVSGSNFQPEEFKIDNYKKLIESSEKVVAIGETGLDFFHNDKNHGNQKKVFVQQIDLAREFDLPLILHARNSKDGIRNAYNEILKILAIKRSSDLVIRGVIHCFGGTLDEAKAFLDLGFFIGFTGVITFPKVSNLVKVVENIPLDRILVETDCPFLAPQPVRGQRNLPQYVRYVAQKVAEIKQISYNEIEKQTWQNTTNLFKL
ncbi:MAG: hypothetical protein A3J62_01830 [Candidatus Buchananbacteria bacterium RIFCSPHIGHO2_02_FULL_38_8]|uniref:Hydrolase TatD n=1 Tax=Candidatus Buchananbacteria bacterium RIFCSPHIGHO2_02_FULL_38_8 TaxID=1797538 RepID=A0A1G1Y4Q6_9BACT|nr:hypothetical protein [uncultured bacterium]OGY47144.1 MAG: hypothetical protein A3J62_01830 [Candidatus Buchananbacteria bacterium RIFCSPHIGHO2_02_FULL_38_8]